jgi:hypothetical protein
MERRMNAQKDIRYNCLRPCFFFISSLHLPYLHQLIKLIELM